LGGNAASDELGNVRPRPQSLGAAIVLQVELPWHGLPVELVLSVVGWGLPSWRPLSFWIIPSVTGLAAWRYWSQSAEPHRGVNYLVDGTAERGTKSDSAV